MEVAPNASNCPTNPPTLRENGGLFSKVKVLCAISVMSGPVVSLAPVVSYMVNRLILKGL